MASSSDSMSSLSLGPCAVSLSSVAVLASSVYDLASWKASHDAVTAFSDASMRSTPALGASLAVAYVDMSAERPSASAFSDSTS